MKLAAGVLSTPERESRAEYASSGLDWNKMGKSQLLCRSLRCQLNWSKCEAGKIT